LEPKLGDFVVFEVNHKERSGLSFLPYRGQVLAFGSQGLAGHERLRGVVSALLPAENMAIVVRMDDESQREIAEFRYTTVVPIDELTTGERDFVSRFNNRSVPNETAWQTDKR
jgi:hypothetical protein